MTNVFYILSRKLYIFLFRISEMDKRCNMISSDKDIFFFLSFDMFSSRESRESRENIHRYRLYVAIRMANASETMRFSRDSRDSRET